MTDDEPQLVGRGRPIVGATYEELIESFMFLAAATDAVVVNKARAEDLSVPCHVTTVVRPNGVAEEMAFKSGLLGPLRGAQIPRYCQIREPMKGAETFRAHFERFDAAAAACRSEGKSTFAQIVSCVGERLTSGG